MVALLKTGNRSNDLGMPAVTSSLMYDWLARRGWQDGRQSTRLMAYPCNPSIVGSIVLSAASNQVIACATPWLPREGPRVAQQSATAPVRMDSTMCSAAFVGTTAVSSIR
jgi:hypothetical protein